MIGEHAEEPETTHETPEPITEIKQLETSTPNQPKEQFVPMQTQTIPKTSEANPETPQESENSETQLSFLSQYFSHLPIQQMSNTQSLCVKNSSTLLLLHWTFFLSLWYQNIDL